MADFVTLTCPNCGGKLQITSDVDRFACGHCGNEHIVKRSGGIVSLAPVVEGLSKVQAGVDKTASELAIVRLEGEIRQISLKLGQFYSDHSAQYLILLGAFSLVVAFMAIIAGNMQYAVSGGVVGVLSIYAGYSTGKAASNNPELKRLKVALQQKNLELARHRDVVGHK